jgi:DNA-binding winged helix-turn-helix (wHTH) protein/tetratricopeptide (TPR) repeat protein
MLYRFGPFTLRESSCVLDREGTPVPLRRQAFAVLRYLVAQRERLVPKRELFDEIWPEARVTDNALSQCMAEIRRALGDNGIGQQVIRTRHGVGFQFVADAAVEPEPLASSGQTPSRGLCASVPVVLVRPFTITGEERLEAELAVEIEHELLRQLVKKSPIPVLHVRSLGETPAARAASEEDAGLGTGFVVEGRVQRFSDRVRLRLRLGDTAARSIIWAERYDARISELLEDEDAVARSAAEGILRAAIRALSRRCQHQVLENLDDRELAVRGIDQFYRRERFANQRAIEYLTELKARGSQSLAVHSYLGRAHYRNIYFMWEEDWAFSIEQVRTAASECMKIDERDPSGPLLLAFTRVFEGDGQQAVALADRVVSAWPDMQEARCLHADFMMLVGHYQDAVRSLRDALPGKRLKEARGEFAAALSAAYFYAESYADAREMARRAIVDTPNSIMNYVVSAASAWHLNDAEAVEVEARRIRRLRPGLSHRPFAGILASTPAEMRRLFFTSLEGAGLMGREWRDEDEAPSNTSPSSHLRFTGVRAAQ